MKETALIVVDMLNDFIDGSMACINAKEAVKAAAAFIDSRTADDTDEDGISGQFPVLFICDRHPADHCSFASNGGRWPGHCISGTRGCAIHDMLMPYASEELTFFKGTDRDREQYSGWQAVNEAGQTVEEVLDLLDINEVFVCGIATEFCVRSTAEDMTAAGKKVCLLGDALAYVDKAGHLKALDEMRAEGISLI